jgi:hypothetical protein
MLTVTIVLVSISLLLWLVFYRDLKEENPLAKNDVVTQITSRKRDTLFDEGLQKLQIQQPKFQDMKEEMHRHIVGLDTFIHSLFVGLLVPG